MDWDNPDKVLLKLGRSYLKARQSPVDKWGLFYLENLPEISPFSYKFSPTGKKAVEFRPFVVNDIREHTEVELKAPPVGYLNATSRMLSCVLTRVPRRAYKIGLSSENYLMSEVFDKTRGVSIDSIDEVDYNSLFENKYPNIGEISEKLKNGWVSLSLGRKMAIFKNALGIHILEVCGTSSAWFWEGKTQLIGKTERDLLEMSIGINLKDLAMEVKNAE